MVLIPEKPCTGWPSKGRERPVGRMPSLPGTVPRPSARLRSAVENLPEVFRCSGASCGAAMMVFAGRMACETSVAGKAFSSASAAPPNRAESATEASRVLIMEIPMGEGLEHLLLGASHDDVLMDA